MDDREKVIKALQFALDGMAFTGWGIAQVHKETVIGALELLKEQEPVKPVFDAGDGKTIGQFLCGKCHVKIGLGHPHFCWYCGKAVKWDEDNA